MQVSQAGSYAYLPLERVVFGRPAAAAAVEEMARVGATRVFIVAAKSVSPKRLAPAIMPGCSTAASSIRRGKASSLRLARFVQQRRT
jgi:hypothetical protein